MDQHLPYNPIYVRDPEGGYKSLYPSEIFYITSGRNYCRIYALSKGKFFVVRKTMKQVDEYFCDKEFSRIHDQYIISHSQINKLDDYFTSVLLKTGEELPIGRQYQENFVKSLDIWK